MRIRKKMQTIIYFGMFFGLCIVFYYALIHATNQYKDQPINQIHQSKNNFPKHTNPPSELDIIMDRAMQWASQTRAQKLATMLQNPVYERFQLKDTVRKNDGSVVKIKRKKVDLLLIVSSGPRRFDRRQAIRQSWWKDCVPTSKVIPKCWFLTDYQYPSDKYYQNITKEKNTYKDVYLQPLRGGIEFGKRFMYHMLWALIHYDFKYFVRIDDDYFLCLHRLLKELPIAPPLKNFHWGYTHCIQEMIRPEESLIMLSRDLVERFLLQAPHEIRCHPWADQMIGVWVTDMNILTLFRTDDRVHHAPIVDKSPYLRLEKKVCNKYIAIHGTYPKDMKLFWSRRGNPIQEFSSEKDRDKTIGNVFINSAECEKPHNFNFLLFEPEWQYEPKRCIYNPTWDTSKQNTVGGVYDGREDNKRLADQDVEYFVGND
eukprot:TCONS_00052162-protein